LSKINDSPQDPAMARPSTDTTLRELATAVKAGTSRGQAALAA
jgi:hypothetical protein